MSKTNVAGYNNTALGQYPLGNILYYNISLGNTSPEISPKQYFPDNIVIK